MKTWIISKLPRRFIRACLIRAWAEYEPKEVWEVHADALMWRIFEQWDEKSLKLSGSTPIVHGGGDQPKMRKNRRKPVH